MRRLLVTALLLLASACNPRNQPSGETAPRERVDQLVDPHADARRELVAQIRRGGLVDDPRVLAAIEAVPRHRFVPAQLVDHAYDDRPLPIGHDVTISQPTIVALMSELADVAPGERVLEVGTGSGYQAAVLAELGAEVYSVERIDALAERSSVLLAELGYAQVHVRSGDGYAGWPERAPFDAIVVTAAPPTIPEALTDQLRRGGKLVAPVGAELGEQELIVIEKTKQGLRERRVLDVAFVPMLPGTSPD